MKRHPLDPLSIVFGLLFAGLGFVFVVARINIASADFRWIWPLPLFGLGALMMILGARRSGAPDEDEVAPATEPLEEG